MSLGTSDIRGHFSFDSPKRYGFQRLNYKKSRPDRAEPAQHPIILPCRRAEISPKLMRAQRRVCSREPHALGKGRLAGNNAWGSLGDGRLARHNIATISRIHGRSAEIQRF